MIRLQITDITVVVPKKLRRGQSLRPDQFPDASIEFPDTPEGDLWALRVFDVLAEVPRFDVRRERGQWRSADYVTT